ncbi:MAG TPA: tRNA (N(6)-L-threonylcarbamoyladenosine(37)-C(2))-methylthiotransferase MtaB, partial [Afifellaceae bacterium]|nr:tRNA (N(6)-L-threonylcarbamoyladenosine(37)-C(2))-methylthiotransferase MtaB [Afifellaceae bacterium]
EAMFENSLQLIADCGLTFLHVFPFSPRKGTPAARMKQLDRALIKQRAARLRAAGTNALQATLAGEIGKSRAVLVEKSGFGRTEHFIPATIDAGRPGDIVPARIVASDAETLTAEAVTPRRVAAA